MKTQTIVILVITLAILFTVFTSKPSMTEKDINKIVSGAKQLQHVETQDLVEDRGVVNKDVIDFPYPNTTSESYELSANSFNNISNVAEKGTTEYSEKTDKSVKGLINKDSIVEKRTGPPVKSESHIPTYYRKDNLSGSTIDSSEYKFGEVDNTKSSLAWSDQNVSQYPNFYTSQVKDELTNIGAFFDKNNQFADKTYPKSTANNDDGCYVGKSGEKVCVNNTRLYNVPPSLIYDVSNCGFLNSIGLLEYSNMINETKERVNNGGTLFGSVRGSKKHNESYSPVIPPQVTTCSI